jgi:hypothetical protein
VPIGTCDSSHNQPTLVYGISAISGTLLSFQLAMLGTRPARLVRGEEFDGRTDCHTARGGHRCEMASRMACALGRSDRARVGDGVGKWGLGSALAEASEVGDQSAEASTGGIASSTADGNVSIDQIITGENTGNTIATGDIAGSAEIHGGEIAYPTEVNVSLTIASQISDASGGDTGKATTSNETVPPKDHIDVNTTVDIRNENTNENTNENELNATITGG